MATALAALCLCGCAARPAERPAPAGAPAEAAPPHAEPLPTPRLAGVAAERREVRFADDDTTLAGGLDLPHGTGPWPLVVIVHHSGPVTRDAYGYLAVGGALPQGRDGEPDRLAGRPQGAGARLPRGARVAPCGRGEDGV